SDRSDGSREGPEADAAGLWLSVQADVGDAPPVAGGGCAGNAQVARTDRAQVDGCQLADAGPAGQRPPGGTVVACRQLPAARVVAEIAAAVDRDLSERLAATEVDLQVLARLLGLAAAPPGGRVAVH